MGLAVEIGVFDEAVEDPEWAQDLRDTFARMNQVLTAQGLPPHVESEHIGLLPSRAECISFPYSFLHYLRRVYAHVKRNSDFVAQALGDSVDLGDDPLLQREYERGHLLCHSDCEGFYIPQDFTEVIVASRDSASSVRRRSCSRKETTDP